MKKIAFAFFAAAVSVGASTNPSFAFEPTDAGILRAVQPARLSTTDDIPPDAERIRFPNGSIEVNLSKSVPAGGAKRFVFAAKAGQEIALTVTPNNKAVKLDIECAGKTVPSGKLFSMIAPRTGDYLIQVLNPYERNQAFTLDLGVAAAPEPEPAENSDGEKVRFADNSASLTRELPANGSMDFIVSSRRSQKLGIQIGYEGKASDIKGFLTEPDMQDISLSMGPESRKEFTVKKTGDHRVTVNNMTRKKITFTLYLDLY